MMTNPNVQTFLADQMKMQEKLPNYFLISDMCQICVLTKVEPVHLTSPMTMFSCITADGLNERSTKFKVLGLVPISF